MEFKIVGFIIWIVVCIYGFVSAIGMMNQASNNDCALGGGIILAILVANSFLIRNIINRNKQ